MRLLTLVPSVLFAASLVGADLPTEVLATYASGAEQAYAASVTSGEALRAALRAFAAAPSETGLVACKQAWVVAREDYSPTEVYRFASGPIDAEPANLETKINAWPLDEQWIDATIDQPQAGLIGALAAHPQITPAVVLEQNEKDGEKNITTGFHAIEFMLWGQDRDPNGPGNRPLSDFTTAANADRRRAFLLATADLLVDHLGQVRAAWAGDQGHRAKLLAGDINAGLTKAFTGAVLLAGDELSGERLAVAWETQDQEEEQSCFSDTTCRDTVLNAIGVQRVWLGTGGRGLKDLVAAKDPAAAERATAAVAAAVAACQAIPAPFDRACQGGNQDPGRKAVLAAIESLEVAADELVVAAKAVGLSVEFGANANNAIAGITDLRGRIPAVVAAIQAGDKSAATAEVAAIFERWQRFEGAIAREAATDYKAIETAMNGLKNEAVRSKTPNLAKVQAAAAVFDAALGTVVPKLKKD